MASVKKPIELGCEAKCKVTGFKGTVNVKHDMLGGNVMWSIQPPVVNKSGEAVSMPEAVAIDTHMLVRTGDGVSKELPPVDTTCTINTGEEVEDKITGFKGTATEMVTFQNGCIYFVIEGPLTQKMPEGLPKSKLFLHSRLKCTAVGVSKDTRLVRTPGVKDDPGGPMVRRSRETYARS